MKLFRCSRFSNFDGKEKRNEIKDGKICFEYLRTGDEPPRYEEFSVLIGTLRSSDATAARTSPA